MPMPQIMEVFVEVIPLCVSSWSRSWHRAKYHGGNREGDISCAYRRGADCGFFVVPQIMEDIMKVTGWVHFVDKVVDVPVGVQRQRVLVQTVSMFRSRTRLSRVIRAVFQPSMTKSSWSSRAPGVALTPGVSLPGVRPPAAQ